MRIVEYNVLMNVSLRELKANLPRYLKDARAGRDVVGYVKKTAGRQVVGNSRAVE